MPIINFSEEHVKPSASRFPKLKLARDEEARINLLHPTPHFEWVHSLKKPEIDRGEAMVETKTRFDGSEYTDYAYDFVGNRICLGNHDTLMSGGLDPDQCAICGAASEHPRWFAAPNRRFAMPVLRYALVPGSVKLRSPYSVDVEVWAFTERRYGELVKLAEEWGNLPDHDLLLGPCKNATYQNFDIRIAPSAEWQADEDTKRITAETWKANQPPDLSAFCGSKADNPQYVEADLDAVRMAYRIAEGEKPSEPVMKAPAEADSESATAPAAKSSGEKLDFDQLLNALE